MEYARKEVDKPTAIICKTFKGKNLGESIEDKLDWHGKDIGEKTNEIVSHLKSLIKT